MIAKWDPFKELDVFQNRLGDLFHHRANAAQSQDSSDMTRADWAPAVDIAETDHEYRIEAELPRIDRERVKIRVADGLLTLTGDREFKREEKDESTKYHRVERSYGSFVRSFRLPDDVEGDKVRAEFKDGVLAVHLPKSEARKPKEIDIKIS
ncbi:MAG: Hsp20/alpha crystallin family protein [Candidatus Methylacidiphilales bacterium]